MGNTKKEFDIEMSQPPEVDLNRVGIHLFMSDVDESSCKDAIEFIPVSYTHLTLPTKA